MLPDYEQDLSKIRQIITDESVSDIPMMYEICNYLIDNNGKMLRPMMTVAFAKLYQQCDIRDYYLAAAIEMIHIATLLHDDVLDQSAQRRGKQTVNMQWGNKPAILAGDYLFAKAFQLLVKIESLDILDLLSHISAILTQGEILQLAHEGDVNIGFDDYYKVVQAKTSALIEASCCGSAIIRQQPNDHITILKDFAHEFGAAFQILDDNLDYDKENSEKIGKNHGDDLHEKKISYPLLYAYQKADSNMREKINDYMQQDTPTATLFNDIFAYVASPDNLATCYAQAQKHSDNAMNHLMALSEHNQSVDEKQKIVDIVRFCTHRRA